MTTTDMQLGKNGITDNFIATLKHHFVNHMVIRISVLKSAGHDKEKIKEYMNQILESLGSKYTAKKIGFKIILRKWRKDMR